MSAKAAFYSVIQFRPNELREEGVNVGLIAGIEGSPHLDARLAKTNERLKRVFGAKAIDDGRLSSAKQALRQRLLQIGEVSEPGLRDFISKEAGQLVILPPRPLLLCDPSADIDALFREVVGDEVEPRRRLRKRQPDLGSHFKRIVGTVPLQADVEVPVPVLRRTLHADYAYRNGALNLIKGQGFAADPGRATTNAIHLGTQGLMLSKNPSEEGVAYKLTVVADFEDPSVASDVETLLTAHSVRMVKMEDVDAYVDEVRREAHE